jgi:hypothetical protein
MAHGQRRIDTVTAFVIVDPADDTEGVPAVLLADGTVMPMLAADPARVASLRPVAERWAKANGVRIEMVRFTRREHLAWIEP